MSAHLLGFSASPAENDSFAVRSEHVPIGEHLWAASLDSSPTDPASIFRRQSRLIFKQSLWIRCGFAVSTVEDGRLPIHSRWIGPGRREPSPQARSRPFGFRPWRKEQTGIESWSTFLNSPKMRTGEDRIVIGAPLCAVPAEDLTLPWRVRAGSNPRPLNT